MDGSYILQIILLDGIGLRPFFTPISKFLEIVCPVADTTRVETIWKNTPISETKFWDISRAFILRWSTKWVNNSVHRRQCEFLHFWQLVLQSDRRVEVQCLHVIRKRSGKKKVKYVTNCNALLNEVNIFQIKDIK